MQKETNSQRPLMTGSVAIACEGLKYANPNVIETLISIECNNFRVGAQITTWRVRVDYRLKRNTLKTMDCVHRK